MLHGSKTYNNLPQVISNIDIFYKTKKFLLTEQSNLIFVFLLQCVSHKLGHPFSESALPR